jgi:hypothetical protein
LAVIIFMTSRTTKIVSGLLSLGLLTTLVIKLTQVPGGMILSGLFLGSIVLLGLLIGSLIVAWTLRQIFKKHSFLTLYFLTTSVAFLWFHYYLYSPTLNVIVPVNYSGQVTLVLSTVKDNILKVDSNGIGYINEWTFKRTYSKPIIKQADGKDITDRCTGFNPSTFWAKGKTCCLRGQQINYLSFRVEPMDKVEREQRNFIDLTKLTDPTLVLTTKLDKYTKIQDVETVPIGTSEK